jgi:hypothetical protein
MKEFMLEPVTMTVLFIVMSTFIAALVKGRKKDKCLKDFRGYVINLEQKNNKVIWGRLSVENTGLELVYKEKRQDTGGHWESSFILYKDEYSSIEALVRFHDDLSDTEKLERKKELKQTYHPGLIQRLGRKIANLFKTVRDSIMEVVNLLLSQAKTKGPARGMLSSQDKYVSRMKSELMESVGTSYEPLLEKYIGHTVIFELFKGDKILEYSCILKDYTSQFVELMDVDYKFNTDDAYRKADMVVPRELGRVRHFAE